MAKRCVEGGYAVPFLRSFFFSVGRRVDEWMNGQVGGLGNEELTKNRKISQDC